VSWAVEEKGYTQRHACRLVGMEPKTYRYVSTRPDEAGLRTQFEAGWRTGTPAVRLSAVCISC
jgi:putative transposase